MTEPQTRNLPPAFAIMRPTSGGGPSYQLCKCVDEHVQSTRLGELDRYFQSVSNLEAELLTRPFTLEQVGEGHDSSIFVTSVRNADSPIADVRKIKWWFLPQKLKASTGELYPVVGSIRRFFVTQRFHRIVPENVTLQELRNAFQEFSEARQAFLGFGHRRDPEDDWLYANQRRLPVKHPVREIPLFVCNLLVKNAIDNNETCAITLTPFSQLPKIGITPCFHLFDSSSIQRWSTEHHKCPTCREKIDHIHEYTQSST